MSHLISFFQPALFFLTFTEEEDLVDDDFDAPEEPPGDDDDDNDGTVGVAGDKSLQRDDRKQAKKPAPYVDPNRGKKSLSAPVPLTAAEKEAAAAAAKSARAARAAALAADRDHSAPADGIAGHRTQRKSAAKAQERREQDRAQQDAAFAARAKARGLTKEELLARQRDRAQVVYRMLTQEEQLEQAKITEVLNRNSLEELLRIEEAQKRITVRKRGVVGAAIFLRDRAGASTVAFKYCAPFDYARSPDSPAVSSSASVGTGAHHGGLVNVEPESSDAPFVPPARRRRLAPGPLPCFVTGAPAKYRDPVTGLPYATAAALQTLRQRVAAAAADGNGAGASELLQAYEARHFAPVPTAEALAEADAAVAAAAAGQAHAQMEMADHDDARVAAAKAGHGRGRKANPK